MLTDVFIPLVFKMQHMRRNVHKAGYTVIMLKKFVSRVNNDLSLSFLIVRTRTEQLSFHPVASNDW